MDGSEYKRKQRVAIRILCRACGGAASGESFGAQPLGSIVRSPNAALGLEIAGAFYCTACVRSACLALAAFLPAAAAVCERCRHEIVPRCGCGARKAGGSSGVASCSADPNHAQTAFHITPTCLCGRGNIGPDRRELAPPARRR